MKAIHLPDQQFDLISQQAAAAGYAEVSAYVQALAEKAAFDARLGMTDDDLQRSAADCSAIEAEMRAGKQRDALQSLGDLAGEFGFGPSR